MNVRQTLQPVLQDSFSARVHSHFNAVADGVLADLRTGEELTLNLSAEETLFVRFNNNRVRQNTDVSQISLSLRLQSAGRTVEKTRTLSGSLDADHSAVARLLAACREEALALPADPNQVPIANNGTSRDDFAGALLAPENVVGAVVGPAVGADLAGLYAGGVVIRANRNSRGQSHWFATQTFFLDYSLYNGTLAAKGSYAGSRWSDADWAANRFWRSWAALSKT